MMCSQNLAIFYFPNLYIPNIPKTISTSNINLAKQKYFTDLDFTYCGSLVAYTLTRINIFQQFEAKLKKYA